MDIVFQPSALLDWCQRIYGPGQRLLLTDYSYPILFGDVAINERVTKQLQITQNADFVLLGFDCASYLGADPVSGYVLISDSATGEQFSNTEIEINNLAASFESGAPDANPLNLPYPRWIGGNTVLTISFRDNADGATDFRMTLRGFLIRKLA